MSYYCRRRPEAFVCVIVLLGLTATALPLPSTGHSDITIEVAVSNLLASLGDIRLWSRHAGILFTTAFNLNQTEMTSTVRDNLNRSLSDTLATFNYTFDALVQRVAEASPKTTLSPTDSDAYTDACLQALKRDLFAYFSTSARKEATDKSIDEISGRNRAANLIGLFDHVTGRIPDIGGIIAAVSSTLEGEGDFAILANLLDDLRIEVVILKSLFVKLDGAFSRTIDRSPGQSQD